MDEARLRGTGTLEPLRDLDRLRRFIATNARIQDVTGLEGCVDLEELGLGQNDIDSLSVLDGALTRLQYVWVDNNDLESLDGLENASKLQMLGAYSNKISDIDALTGASQLWWLHLGDNRLEDSALTGLFVDDVSPPSQIQYLWLYSNSLTSIAPLSNLNSLSEISVQRNRLTSLDGIQNATPLYRIEAWENRLSDLSAVVDNTDFSSGDYLDVGINDFSCLVADSQVATLEARGVTVISYECD